MRDVVVWWAENIYEAETNESSEIHTAKLEYWQAKARVEKVKADTLEESVIKKEDVVQAWAFRLKEVANMLAALGMRLAPLIVGKDELESRQIINEETNNIRDNFARKGKFMGG